MRLLTWVSLLSMAGSVFGADLIEKKLIDRQRSLVVINLHHGGKTYEGARVTLAASSYLSVVEQIIRGPRSRCSAGLPRRNLGGYASVDLFAKTPLNDHGSFCTFVIRDNFGRFQIQLGTVKNLRD